MGERSDDMKIQEGVVVETARPTEHTTHVEGTLKTTPVGGGDAELEAIRSEIEQTRAEMSETLNAIQARLSPDHLKEQAREKVREATIGRAKDMAGKAGRKAKGYRFAIADAMKRNPLPTALIGLGVGWLVMESSKSSPDRDYDEHVGRYMMDEDEYLQEDIYQAGLEYPGRGLEHPGRGEYGRTRVYTSHGRGHHGMGNRVHETMGAVKESASSMQERAGSMATHVRERAGELAGGAKERVTHTTEQARERAAHLAEGARERVGHLTEQARDTAGYIGSQARAKAEHWGGQVQHQAYRARSGVQEMMEDNPLALAAAAFVIGAVMGFSLPETRKEHELMGDMRDTLKEKAKEYGQETIEKVQHVAEVAQQAAKEEAEKQHLTGQETMGKVESVVNEAKEAAKGEAKKEGLTG